MNVRAFPAVSRSPWSTPRLLALAGAFVAATAFALPARGQSIDAGRQKAEEVCAACHGKDGNTPIDPSYPKLAGQYQDYLEHSLLDYKHDRRKNPIMGAQAKPLSRADIRNVAAYYASLPGTVSNHADRIGR
ncbi:MAG: cytochrome c [Burkholderiaceae bacterium]|nr:cytochrome c [Burkholderiaceae bacterium]